MYFSSAEENETQMLDMLQTLLPNINIFYWQENKEIFSKCQKLPDIFDLKFNNKYWQVKETGDNTFFLYAAYFDSRHCVSLIAKNVFVLNCIILSSFINVSDY